MAAARGSAVLHGLLQVEAGAEMSHVAAHVAAVLRLQIADLPLEGGWSLFFGV